MVGPPFAVPLFRAGEKQKTKNEKKTKNKHLKKEEKKHKLEYCQKKEASTAHCSGNICSKPVLFDMLSPGGTEPSRVWTHLFKAQKYVFVHRHRYHVRRPSADHHGGLPQGVCIKYVYVYIYIYIYIYICIIDICLCMYIYIYISADTVF